MAGQQSQGLGCDLDESALLSNSMLPLFSTMVVNHSGCGIVRLLPNNERWVKEVRLEKDSLAICFTCKRVQKSEEDRCKLDIVVCSSAQVNPSQSAKYLAADVKQAFKLSLFVDLNISSKVTANIQTQLHLKQACTTYGPRDIS